MKDKRQHRLEHAFLDALSLVADRAGFTFSNKPQITLVPNDRFWARASIADGDASVAVTSTCLIEIETLWNDVWADRILLGADGDKIKKAKGGEITKDQIVLAP